jgi:hypothetical protein
LTETEQDKQFRRELEAAGEQAIRDDLNYLRGISTGGETKRQFVLKWLREKELVREAHTRQAHWYCAMDVLGRGCDVWRDGSDVHRSDSCDRCAVFDSPVICNRSPPNNRLYEEVRQIRIEQEKIVQLDDDEPMTIKVVNLH